VRGRKLEASSVTQCGGKALLVGRNSWNEKRIKSLCTKSIKGPSKKYKEILTKKLNNFLPKKKSTKRKLVQKQKV